jgi:hypothetical protein
MRGAAVPSGRHRLVYFYKPRSFRVGRVVSILGLGGLALMALVAFLRPANATIGAAEVGTNPEESRS